MRYLLPILAVLAFCSPAHAESTCPPRDELLQELAQKYGEERRSVSVIPGHGLAEMYANPETGSWTFVVTTPGGRTCVLAAGAFYQETPNDTPA